MDAQDRSIRGIDMNQTLLEQYIQVISTNKLYLRNRDQWEYLLNSYMGGIEYKRAGMLTKYVNETDSEYLSRINSTHLENHCKSVVSTYISFMFRQEPKREFGSIEYEPMLESFLEDCDHDGRSFTAFMKETAVWSSVFGHCWIMVVKPNLNQPTLAAEQFIGARPYLTILTPLTVMDWIWQRLPSGKFVLSYLKYAEEANDTMSIIKEWTKESITTYEVNHKEKAVKSTMIEVNGLGDIPAILAYNQRSPVRGIGVSDINDIADAQRFIYNLNSEVEQSVRINGHPALVKTPGTEAAAGAGAIIQIDENLDPGLKPYILSVSTDINSIYNSINHVTNSIDKMANTGSIRATEARRMSGVAQEQEFQLLNARLSEKSDNLELAEEQIWQWYAQYQGYVWDGKIEYPDSFAIRDTFNEIEALVRAKQAATDPRVFNIIDHELIELLGEEADMIIPEIFDPREIPEKKPFEPHYMINPETGEKFIARTEQEHLDYAALGYIHEKGE